MDYEVRFTRNAERQLVAILRSCPPSDRRRFQEALSQLESNPYSTNPDVPSGIIKQVRGIPYWRYRVSAGYRMVYSIEDNIVTIRKVGHRRDVYKGL